MVIERTLYGGCGVEGCLDCTPSYLVEYDSSTGESSQVELVEFFYVIKED